MTLDEAIIILDRFQDDWSEAVEPEHEEVFRATEIVLSFAKEHASCEDCEHNPGYDHRNEEEIYTAYEIQGA